ncbi:hypothetical protein [Donghicola eburneus]|uniref:hypothetical protein n=1 Tax=Donghicola eburneus TaxID=393278 RepID=UPI0008E22A01|nr:hypothetical protein [Donghicola eburneus]SFQ52611.1 hypothetical protein SAMN05421764_105141 [Donghicola eburneus]
MGKPWWRSKTYWFNALMALMAVIAELTPIIDHLVAAGYDAEWVAPLRAGIAFVTVIGNMILRAITTEPVTLR